MTRCSTQMRGCRFERNNIRGQNTASPFALGGGGISMQSGTFTGQGLTFKDNVNMPSETRESYGSAFAVAFLASVQLSETVFTGNTGSYCGAMTLQSASAGDFLKLNFTGNSAVRGAGLCITDQAKVGITDSGFRDNTASEGGAVHLLAATILAKEVEAVSNRAQLGAVFHAITASSITMIRGKYHNNHADAAGGLAYLDALSVDKATGVETLQLLAENTAGYG